MKTASLYLPLFFILIFLIYAFAHAVSEQRTTGIFVEIGGLEESCKKEMLLYHDPLTIHISAGNRLALNREQVDPRTLSLRLKEIYDLRAESTAFIAADPDLEFGQVISVLDIVNQSAHDTHLELITPQNRENMCADAPMLPGI